MKFAVTGSRSIVDPLVVAYILDWYKSEITSVIHGGAKGVDSLAYQWAQKHQILVTVVLPDWQAHGKAADPIRNRTIVEHAEKVIAIWDGVSKGTKGTIDYARRICRPVDLWVVAAGTIELVTEYPVSKSPRQRKPGG